MFVREQNVGKSSRNFCERMFDDTDVDNMTESSEEFVQVIFGGFFIDTVNVQLFVIIQVFVNWSARIIRA